MDKDLMVFAALMAVVVVSVSFSVCFIAYLDTSKSNAAIESGYSQKIDHDTGRVLWVKDESK